MNNNKNLFLAALALILLGVTLHISLAGMRPTKGDVVMAAPLPTSTPFLGGDVLTLEVPAGLERLKELTVLNYTVKEQTGGFVLVDEDGDAFQCETLPQTVFDLELCVPWR